MATLLAEAGRIRMFPDVANLPLRGPAMIAMQAASLTFSPAAAASLAWAPAASGTRSRRWAARAARHAKPSRRSRKRSAPSGEIRRVYNVMGSLEDTREWVERLTGFALELGFDTFVFWPAEEPVRSVERLAAEVVPAVREAVRKERER